MKKYKQEIDPKNFKGESHGYQEWYDALNRVYVRCMFKNGFRIGYEEWHVDKETVFYII